MDDHLDGCDIEFSDYAIPDEELLAVIFGDDEVSFAEYRLLFSPSELPDA